MKKICVASGIAMGVGFLLALVTFLFGAKTGVRVSANGVQLIGRPEAANISADGDAPGTAVVVRGEQISQVQVTDMELGALQGIDVKVDLGDIVFAEADRFGVDLLSYQIDGETQYAYEVRDGTLHVWERGRSQRNEGWSLQFGFNYYGNDMYNMRQNKVTVYLPAGAELRGVSAETSMGQMDIGGFACATLDVNNNFGGIRVGDVQASSAVVKGDSVDMELDMLAADSLEVKDNFGAVRIIATDSIQYGDVIIKGDSCDITVQGMRAASLDLKDNFGAVELRDVNVQRFEANMDSCDLTVDGMTANSAVIKDNFGVITLDGWQSRGLSLEGNSCDMSIAGALYGDTEIENDFGSVEITTKLGRDQYALELETSFGGITVDGSSNGTMLRDQSAGRKHRLDIECNSGDIILSFGQ